MVQEFSDKCFQAKVRFMKTVQLRVPNIDELLHANKDLKIIILMRDPRGIMKSRTNEDWCGDNHKPHCRNVTELCQQMEHDLTLAISMKELYTKERITLVRYKEL